MTFADTEITAELEAIRRAGLFRELRRVDSAVGPRLEVDGRMLVNFSSNDYLGLAHHPRLAEAATRAIAKFGTGSGASRLICGSLAPHHDLEDALAAWKGTEAALTFSSGYATALGAITALLGRDDVVVVDKRVHASCVDGARLSGARLRAFAHNDLEALERILKWADSRANTHRPSTPEGTIPGQTAADAVTPSRSGQSARRRPRVLVVTESVFSMDGDLAHLREIVELKDRHGAWLMLDEAHATGVFGEKRCGLADAFGLADRIEIHMGTLGKALGSAGGYLAGSRVLIDLLINRARSFIFSTAPPPAQAAASLAAVELIQGTEGAERRDRLWALVDRLKNDLLHAGCQPGLVRSPILPLIVGEEATAVRLAETLRDSGIFVPAIRYPTVARGAARLRVTVSAAHEREDLLRLATALGSTSSASAETSSTV